jgi:hypothetical protein
VNEYKRGRTSIQDEQRCGLPKSVTGPEMVAKIHEVVLKDRRLKLSEIDFTRAGVQYFNSRIGYEKAIGAMGVAHSIKNLFECKFRKSVGTVLRIQHIFCVDLLQPMKPGSTFIPLKQNCKP